MEGKDLLPPTRPGDKYYWVNRASTFYIHKMLELRGVTECEEHPPYTPDARYMMYRLRCFKVPGSCRWCEFLIEYDIYHPSHGIYFGCKVVTDPDCDHRVETTLATADWERVHPIMLLRLNNVFPDKDFTHRFRLTDNDANHTFWPFWIQLYEDEGIIDFGLRALNLIAAVYTEYYEGSLPKPPAKGGVELKKLAPVRTAFTLESRNDLDDALNKLVREESTTGVAGRGTEGAKLFHYYLRKAQEAGWIHRNGSYEYAWMLSAELHDVDFHELMQNIFARIARDLGLKKANVPWGALVRVFLRADGTAMKPQIRTLTPKAALRKLWKARVAAL